MGIKNASFRKVIVWMAGLVLAATALADPVPVLTVAPHSASATFELEGVVQAVRQATLAAQVGGNVIGLPVKAGDRLKAGQLVARLDARDALAALQRSDAGVVQAEGVLRSAKLAVERSRELRRQGFISQAALDVAETELSTAQGAADQSRAARSQAALAQGFATLSAPFDAVVLATHVERGDLALPGRAVATLYAPGALRVAVQVPASRVGAARSAQRLSVRLPDGQALKPVQQTFLPSTDPVSQTVELRLDLEARSSQALLPGQSVIVQFEAPGVPAAAAPATPAVTPWVPRSAVLQRGELTAVYVAQRDGFALRSVRTGTATADGRVPVWAGLQPGEQIATDAVRAGLSGATPAR
jgi:RND family efflux transporter MFP subunit